MLRTPDLNHFERKLVTIFTHHTKRGHNPTLEELEQRTGHSSEEIKEVIQDLIKRNWLGVSEGKVIVVRKLF